MQADLLELRGRLLLGVVVVRVGEFIVGLQIVRTDIQRLSLRMAAEIERRQRRRAMVAGAAGRRPRRRAAYSVPELRGWRGAKRRRRTGPAVAAVARFDCRPIRPAAKARSSKCFAFRNGQRQAARARGVEGFAFGAQQGLFMRRVQDRLAAGHRSDDDGRSRRRRPGCARRCRRPPGSAAGPRLPAGWNSR